MSIIKKVKNSILFLLIIIEILLLFILYIKKPIPESILVNYAILFKPLAFVNLIIFMLSILCYILEHKAYNKKEYIFDENMIEPNFDISLKNNDILYLSTILKQQYPERKEIILLIMQLINKKVIDLSSYWDGKKYQYFIEKRSSTFSQTTSIEKKILHYLFNNSNKVNLLNKVKEIYSFKNDDVSLLVKQIHAYMEELKHIVHNPLKPIYKILTLLLSIGIFFLGFCFCGTYLLSTEITMIKFSSSIEVIINVTFWALLCIFVAFIYTIILKKFNAIYQYNNDSYSWLCKNLIFIFTNLIISYLFPLTYVIQFITITIYFFTTLTIMIKYNDHISLYQNDIITRNKLISLKNYFKYMNYLEDKYFGNIITYEECLMYGFLFNITIKINKEFDLLQKELLSIVKKEGLLYLKLFKDDIL